MISLCAFFGNIGQKYEKNRHNAGFLLEDEMSLFTGVAWQAKFRAKYAAVEINGRKIHFLMPLTYMNASGESVLECATFFKIKPDEIIVAHDELELPFGTVSFKLGGGLGGHNGLRSTKACLNTPDFYRFRIGIGRPDHPDVAGYVLTDFSRDEEQRLKDSVFPRSGSMLERFISDGPDSHEDWFKKIDLLKP